MSGISLIGQETRFPHWHRFSFETVAHSQDALLAFTNDFLNTAILKQLADHLNTLHGVSHGIPYWRTLAMPYILELWGIVAGCFLTLAPALSNPKTATVETLATSGPWNFVDMIDFNLRGLKNPAFYHWILSQLCQDCAPSTWTLSPTITLFPEAPDCVESMPNPDPRRFQGVHGFSEPQRDALSWMLRFKACFKKTKLPKTEPGAPYASTKPIFADHALETLFTTTVCQSYWRLLLETLPQTLTTHYGLLQTKAKKQRYRTGGLRVSRTSFYQHEQIKFYMANALEAGEVLLGSQHGGSYGIDLHHYGSYELEIKNRWFITWGWDSQNGIKDNLIPLPSPELSRCFNQHNPTSDAIVMVGNVIHPLGVGCLYSEHFGPTWPHYLADKHLFLEGLSPDKLDLLRYRAHPDTRCRLDEWPSLSQAFPTLQRCEGDLMPWLLSASLVVMDNASTTLNTLVAANTPFMVILNPAIQLAPEATPFFDLWHQAGIAFYNPEAAAKAINALSDIQAWWQTETVQTARLQWLDRYAKTSPTPFKTWAKCLWNL
ncbi:MAG: hypothetical protein AB7F28_07595 [Candidatus Margulisiibacteriota bacterium]